MMFFNRFRSVFISTLLVLSSFFIFTSLYDEKSRNITLVENFAQIEHLFTASNDTTYLINFWATTCPPCLKELPLFEKVADTYADKKFKLLLINIDDKKRLEKYVLPFIKKKNIRNDVYSLTDENYNIWTAKVNKEWYGALPYTVIYKNNVKKYYFGAFKDLNDVEKEISQIMTK